MFETLHLYAKDSPLEKVNGCVGLLCELATDTPALRNAEHCYWADEILGSPDDALATSYSLISKLLQSTPVVDGLPLLSIFEESLLEQCSYLVQAFHLDRWISDHKFSICRFVSDSPWLDRLRRVREITGSDYQLTAAVPLLQTTVTGKVIRKSWTSRPSLREVFRRVAPLWWRHLSAIPLRRHAKKDTPREAIWFYSTAYNYTKVALEYETYLPGKLNFLVEDPSTGGRHFRDREGDWRLLYAWSRIKDIPSASEVRSIGHKITAAIAATSVAEPEILLRDAFLKSEWYRHFLTRLLPFAIYNGRVLRRWRRSVAPKMILVGNAAWERALLMNKNNEPRVPVVMLQHGIMHWVFSVSDQPVDTFLLRGPFFQSVINEKLRQKTVICNFPTPSVAGSPHAEQPRDSILFITTPYEVPELFHPEDLCDILRSLLRVSHSQKRRLIIRVHPVERISTYQRLVLDLQRDLRTEADVVYSQGPGVEEVLARTCLAVLHFSTMFLDCLRHGIPIVSFGWHWFPYKRQFENEVIFNFASDLRSFESLLVRGLEKSLHLRTDMSAFMGEADPTRIATLFKEIYDSGGSSRKAIA